MQIQGLFGIQMAVKAIFSGQDGIERTLDERK